MSAPTQAPAPEQAPKKSIWKNKWLWIVVGAVLVVGAIGSALGGGSSTRTDNSTAAASAGEIEIPDVVGMPGNEAEKALRDLGLSIQRDGGEESVIDASNWDVERTDPAAGSKVASGTTVTVYFVRAEERLAAEQAERDAASAERNAEYAATPIEATEAQSFCDNYANLAFPYGVKMHWIVGKLAEEPRDSGGWYLKVEATVTNEYGAEQSGVNVECHISGTNGAPVMDDFLYY